MIDMAAESLVPLSLAGEHLPKNHQGKLIGRATLRRWTLLGRRGVLLEYVALGGLLYTSVEALQRFAERQTEMDLKAMRPPEMFVVPPSRRKEIAANEAWLRSQGLMD